MEQDQDSGTARPQPKGHGLASAATALKYLKQGLSKDDFLKEAEYAYQTATEQQSRREKDLSEEEVEKILQAESASPAELLQLMNWYDVRDHKKLETDAMRRERLRYHLKKQQTSCRSVAELLGNVQKNAKYFQMASESLSKTANDILKFAKDRACTDTRLRECIDRDFPGWEEQLQMSISHLEKKECLILVTGEVSVGKTSFLNLLFEGEIANFQLPQRERGTTSCICEIRYGPHKRVVAHRDKPQPGESETIEITHEDVTRERLDELINYDQFKQSGNKVPFKKIEIFVPAEFLKNGLVLVDTPGIGHDRQDMVQFINDYLQHSVGFIYVLTNALDVHKLCKLFKLDKSKTDKYIGEDNEVEELTERLARQTLFVANKWDLIEDEDVMMKELEDKVNKYWMIDGDRQSKVLKLSAKNDSQHFGSGYVSDRLRDVIAAFEKIVVHNMMLQLRRHYRSVEHV
jgi:GTP-binding protein EngB required for normal cell division